MTENTTDSKMAVDTNTALKDTLRAQQQLLQKLYNELDVEREASATAASEALAMILRLQGEKAAVKMEAEQYKRLAEAKMYHAEESMEIFEDLIHQKEMEIASLDFQVQAYRYKLASLGFEEIEPNETSVSKTSPESLLRRNSAPPKLLKLAYSKRGNLERNRSVSPDSDTIQESARVDEDIQSFESEKQTDGFSYRDQIRRLDKIVEEMARSSRSSSVFSQLNEVDQPQNLKNSAGDEMVSDTCSLSVHDVFEVPEANEKQAIENGKSILKCEKDEKLVMKSYDKVGEKTLVLKQKDKQAFFPRDGMVVDCHMAIDRPATYVVGSQAPPHQVNSTSEIKEDERQDVRSEEQVSPAGREEMMRLLNEINGKLDSIQSEIRSGKTEIKKPSSNYDLPMLQLKEAMLHFWL